VKKLNLLKKFGIGLAGMALACFGLANKAAAGKCAKYGQSCAANIECCSGWCSPYGFCGCITGKDCPPKTGCNLGYCMGGMP
jgi:hypothetical protein